MCDVSLLRLLCCADTTCDRALRMVSMSPLVKPQDLESLEESLLAPLPVKFPLSAAVHQELLAACVSNKFKRDTLEELTEVSHNAIDFTAFMGVVSL